MSALAKLLSYKGYFVSGYDQVRGEQTEELSLVGIPVFIGDGEDEYLKKADVVVYTDALSLEDTRIRYAREKGKILFSRGRLLAEICASFRYTVGVSGSHGKTTCTAMCAHILQALRVPFCAHIGGMDGEFGNFYACGDEYFVTEACEYKKNMLSLPLSRAVLLNIDNDHAECYDGEEDIVDCFSRYCKQAEEAFVCADDEKCMRFGRNFTTFGIENPHCDYRAVALKQTGEKYIFGIEEYGEWLCKVRLNVFGKCNVYNALAAFSVMRSFGFPEREIVKGLETFTAVKRRFEKIGQTPSGGIFLCDYAHHPREIAATIETARKICEGELYIVFQPHTYSRTRLLFCEFVELFRNLPNVMIYKTYPAREFYDEEGSAERLACTIGNCLYSETVKQLGAWLTGNVKENDVVLFLGAGDIYYVAQYLLREWK